MLMPTVLSFLFRALLLAVGLVFAAGLAVVFAMVLVIWLLRAAWARVTGRPVTPFVMRFHPGQGFDRMYRRGAEASRTPRADSVPTSGRIADVTDVEPK
jgi:hypothetical protein